MKCNKITNASSHFEERYYRRVKNIELSYLLKRVEEEYGSGNYIYDQKHSGIKGPRYNVFISIADKTYKAVIEKTAECIVPITLFPHSR